LANGLISETCAIQKLAVAARDFARVIRENDTITILALRLGGVESAGTSWDMAAFEANTSIEELVLHGFTIDADAANTLAKLWNVFNSALKMYLYCIQMLCHHASSQCYTCSEHGSVPCRMATPQDFG